MSGSGWDPRSLAVPARSARLASARLGSLARRANQRAPLAMKAVPTAIGFAFGDVLTQYMNWKGTRQPAAFQYEWKRGLQMAGVGALLAGPLGLGLLRWMDAHIMTHNPRGLAAMTVKLTLDQVVGCLLWQAAYMVIHPPYRQAAQELLGSLQGSLQEQTAGVKRRLAHTPRLAPA